MPLDDSPIPRLEHLQQLVIDAARAELLPRLARVSRQAKADGSIVTEADLALQERLTARLRRAWPHIQLLGEEMPAEQQAGYLAEPQPLWCLDPLDGTSNFAAGIPYFAVSLALVHQGRVVLGIVYDPVRDECFASAEGAAASLNGSPLQLGATNLGLRQATAMVDFKRLPKALATRLAAEPPFASQRNFGAVALDWCWLAAGRGHLYLHGAQNLWDYAAGHFIFQRAGGHAATLDGKPVFTHALQTRSAVGAVDGELFSAWHAWLRAASASP